MNSTASSSDTSWLVRHEFLLRRLHSLSGLIPVGAYMVVHLLTNASVLDSAATFQGNVYRIHSLGRALPLVEWGFIFLPLIFHAVFGVIIIRGGLPNNSNYPYARNVRYTLQRVSGMIAFVFIFWHVFHLHGWFHTDFWLTNIAEPLNGANFRPFNASSSLAIALTGWIVPTLYAIGVLACVFHLANGIWTMGITWGVWISPAAQQRANWACLVVGLGLAVVGLSALVGVKKLDVDEALQSEERMYEAKLAGQEIAPPAVDEHGHQLEHKRFSPEELEEVEAGVKRQEAAKPEAEPQQATRGGSSPETADASLPARATLSARQP